jgi:transcriptional regulator GlxA family with amidase domain
MKARHLLRHSDESVTDIAYRCGSATVTTFRRFFAGSLLVAARYSPGARRLLQ